VPDATISKLAAENHTILVPRPSDAPLDPLNWSKIRKNVILFVISASASLIDYYHEKVAVPIQYDNFSSLATDIPRFGFDFLA
jgi:hypothetical protein